jgi:hypothetical protein
MQHGQFNMHEKKTLLSLGFSLLIVVLMLCSCGGTGASSTATPPSTNQNGGTGASPTATQSSTNQGTGTTPTADPTKVPSNTGSAFLGGSENGFIAKYGKPNAGSADYHPHFERCANSQIDQISLSQVSLESKSGPIISVLLFACSSTSWSMTQATSLCSSFFPSDAQFQRSVQVPAANGQPPSVDKIYYSAMLAHTFAADNFTDNNGTLVQPGLFDVNYFYVSNNDTSHFNECDLEVGDSQTSPN